MNKIFSLVVVTGLMVLVGAGCNYQVEIKNKDTNQPADKTEQNNIEKKNVSTTTDTKGAWQTYSDSKYSYKCPTDWVLYKNLNYNGQVKLSECTKTYSKSYGFDDGVSVTFGFVPQTVSDNEAWVGENISTNIIDGVKNELNAQPYTNNKFAGWVSMKNEKRTGLKLVARYPVNDGYYEVTADAAGSTYSDVEYLKMINDVVASFEIK